MIPRFANSATITVHKRLVVRGGRGKVHLRARYGILEHPTHGTILIDTGYGVRVTQARDLPMRAYRAAISPQLHPDQLPMAVLKTRKVDKIILTHLHADHTAALRDFPDAQVILDRTALNHMRSSSRFSNLAHGVFPQLVSDDLEERVTDISDYPLHDLPFGLGKGRDILGDQSMLSVSLPGHAQGHFGVCFAQLKRPLLYACDVQWHLDALVPKNRPKLAMRMVSHNYKAAHDSSDRVHAFAKAGGQVMLCHDPDQTEYDL